MATITRRQPNRVGNTRNEGNPMLRGGPEEKTWIKEAASQTYGAGDLIHSQASDGKMAICTVDGSTNLSSQIGGQAITKATGVTDSELLFHAITPQDIYEMNVYHGTIGSAVTALTQLGKSYPVKKISGIWLVDLEVTGETTLLAQNRVKVIGFSPKDKIGDTYGRVKVRFQEVSVETDGGLTTRVLQFA